MSTNLDNTYVAGINNEDIKILTSSVKDINKDIDNLLLLLESNRLPIVKELTKMVKNKTFRLIFDERLAHATVRWVKQGSTVFINVTPKAKLKKGMDNEYIISTSNLYSFLIGAAVVYFTDKLNYNREYLNDVANCYIELMAKVFMKGGKGYFKSNTEAATFHYIMLYYLFKNNKTVVSNIAGYAKKIAELPEDEFNILNKKYDLDKICDAGFDSVFNGVLVNEFSFMKKLNPTMLLHTMAVMYGPYNTYLLDNIETIGCLMVDNVMGNRLSLNAEHGAFQGVFKSHMYNNIIEVIKSKL